jgi:CRP/FNR family transcriptional regulator
MTVPAPDLSSPQIVLDLFKGGRHVDFPAGMAVFREGDPVSHVYCVDRGNVVVARYAENGARQILAFLFPGDFLGITVGPRYNTSAEALTAVSAWAIPQSRLLAELSTRPAMGVAFAEMSARILDNALDLIFTLGRKQSRARVASFLLKLLRRQERLGLSQAVVHLPMTRQDVADALGLTMETVSRSFSQLKASGAIRFQATDVEVADLAKLTTAAQFKP